MLGIWAVISIWVLRHPPALSSDDALFFTRGLTRFSVLDFSPQFPGYPGFILIGRAVLWATGDALFALSLLCAVVALALPWIAAWVAKNCAGPQAAALAFLLTLTIPLGPNLALNLLSDGAGVFFIVVSIALLPHSLTSPKNRMQAFMAGLMLGWALACRPSNLILVLAAATGASITAPRMFWPLWLGMGMVLGPVIIGLFALEPLYLIEGARFVQGHAEIWGNTALTSQAHQSWATTLFEHPLVAILLSIETLAMVTLPMMKTSQGRPARMALAAGFFGHLFWTLWFQNPNSLRHLVPLLVLGGVGLAVWSSHSQRRQLVAVLAIAIGVLSLAQRTNLSPTALPPLIAVTKFLAAEPTREPTTLVTNYGVQLMRSKLPNAHVYDAYYTGSTALGTSLSQGSIWRLSGTKPFSTAPLDTSLAIPFHGRFLGERRLWMQKIRANILQPK